jgi:hypothetical protein
MLRHWRICLDRDDHHLTDISVCFFPRFGLPARQRCDVGTVVHYVYGLRSRGRRSLFPRSCADQARAQARSHRRPVVQVSSFPHSLPLARSLSPVAPAWRASRVPGPGSHPEMASIFVLLSFARPDLPDPGRATALPRIPASPPITTDRTVAAATPSHSRRHYGRSDVCAGHEACEPAWFASSAFAGVWDFRSRALRLFRVSDCSVGIGSLTGCRLLFWHRLQATEDEVVTGEMRVQVRFEQFKVRRSRSCPPSHPSER